MTAARDAIMWLLRVQTDYRYKVECVNALNAMYEYYS